MRICFNIGNLGTGGIGLWAINLSQGFVEHGAEVDFFLMDSTSKRLALIDKRINVNISPGRAATSGPALRRLLRQRKPDVLMSAHAHIACLGELCRRAQPARILHIVTYHTNTVIDVAAKGIWGRVFERIGYWAASRADGIVAVSQGVADDLESRLGWSKERIKTIYNPAWSDQLADNASKPVPHPWLAADRTWKTIIAIGRLTQQKDFSTLLKGFAILTRNRNVKLIILGDGEDREPLNRLVKTLRLESSVDMPGYTSDAISYLEKADLFVLSSAWEGFGNVIVEALGAGTPVVATNCPFGPSEILQQGRFGTLVRVGNVKELASAMETALDADCRRPELQQRAQDFHLSRIARQYLQYFENL